MKIITLLTIAISINSWALDEAQVAGLYSDSLIEQFDRILDEKITTGDSTNMLSSTVYSKLLSCRSVIEHSNKVEKAYLPMIIDSRFYNTVVKKIDQDALAIFNNIQQNIPQDSPVIYPDSGSAGNIIGNKFPRGYWALTFDDGPKKGRTQEIVDTLYQSGLNATFFMVVEMVERFPNTAQYVLDAGFELALHSYTHINLAKASAKQLNREIHRAKSQIEKKLKRPITFFRLPFGAGVRKKQVRDEIAKGSMIHVFWNVDSLDWKDKSPTSIMARVKKQMKLSRNKSGVILFHDLHQQTVQTTKLLTEHFNRNNLQTCHLADFVNYINGKSQSCIK